MVLYGLDGKVAIITGAAGGIGAAMARELGRQGCDIAIIDVKDAEGGQVAEELAENSRAQYYHCDISDIAALRRTFDAIVADFGGVDILINNAGVGAACRIEEMTPEKWNLYCGINMTAPFFLSKMAVPYMAAKKWGRIINISSIRTRQINDDNHTAYHVTKTALESITKNFGVIYGKDGITANALGVAYLLTPMTARYLNQTGGEERWKESTPQGRLYDPREVADMAAFLASDRASAINAQIIFMDGGASCYSPVKSIYAKMGKKSNKTGDSSD